MNEYEPFLISNFRSGFNESLEPWLLPGDAFPVMKNAHLYRGVVEKIAGYSTFTRMAYRNVIQLSPDPDGATKTFTGTLSSFPVTNSFFAQSTVTYPAYGAETWSYLSSDPGGIIINLTSNLGGTGTVNLNTLAVSLTFNTAPIDRTVAGHQYNRVFFEWDAFAAGKSIMGIKPYFKSDGTQEVLIFDTLRMGKVVEVTGNIPPYLNLNYGIQEIPHEVDQEDIVTFDGIAVNWSGTLSGFPIVPNSVQFQIFDAGGVSKDIIIDHNVELNDTASSNLLDPAVLNAIDYVTGQWRMSFLAPPTAGWTLSVRYYVYGDTFSGDESNFFSLTNYTDKAFFTNNKDLPMYYDGSRINFLVTTFGTPPAKNYAPYDITRALHVLVNRERLILLAVTVQGNQALSSAYWSKAGLPLDWSDGEFLQAPTSEPIKTFSIINYDVVVRFANSERVLRYTADAFSPFRWDATNNLWRCDSPYSAINYDAYFTSIGKPAIVYSDGVNVARADAIIPDFTLPNAIAQSDPIIAIDPTNIQQCYGERFDEFKEGWLCYRGYNASDNTVPLTSTDVLAFNYSDKTYSVYTFPFTCLGYGAIVTAPTWGTIFTEWQANDDTWGSYLDDAGALINLSGDKNGYVYELGDGTTLGDPSLDPANKNPVLMDIITKNLNPYIEQGEIARFGYVDFLLSTNAATKFRVQFYKDDELYLDPDGTPNGYYQETTLTLSEPTQTKVWKRIYVGAIGQIHSMRIYQSVADFTVDTYNQPVRIHGIIIYMKPAGRLFS